MMFPDIFDTAYVKKALRNLADNSLAPYHERSLDTPTAM